MSAKQLCSDAGRKADAKLDARNGLRECDFGTWLSLVDLYLCAANFTTSTGFYLTNSV